MDISIFLQLNQSHNNQSQTSEGTWMNHSSLCIVLATLITAYKQLREGKKKEIKEWFVLKVLKENNVYIC